MKSSSIAWMRTAVAFAAISANLGAANTYLVHNLVSDLPGIADKTDSNLVNPWGVAFSGTGPFWVGNNHTGTSTLYDGAGSIISLVVAVPAPGGQGAVTGVIFNGTQSFAVAPDKPASFLFCTEDGVIAGWNTSVDATHAKILVDNSASRAVYKGCAIGGTAAAPLLYAANFRAGAVDVFGGDLKPVQTAGAFQDAKVPAGFAPFNILNLGGKLYVSYARQSADKMDDVAGQGNGYVAVFDMAGSLVAHLISQGALNSPWGMAIAPAGFGDFGKALLVGNFGDGAVHAFDINTGAMLGGLNDLNGKPIAIQGLWTLLFGNGGRGGDASTLYFTAGIPGPNGDAVESHGLFGSIQSAPSFPTTAVVNAASFSGTLAANAFATIQGGGLSATTRTWQDKDFVNNRLPAQLDGVGVTVNGKPAFVSYISPSQINFLLPADVPAGPATVQTTNNGLTSAVSSVTMQSAAPSFFLFGGTKYIAATHSDGASLVGPPSLITGATTTPAKTGETVVLYANGFGATTPPVPNGLIVNTALNLIATPTVTIGGLPAQVTFAGLTATGLYQINAVVPAVTGTGAMVDAAVVAQASGMQSQPNAFLSVVPAPPAPTPTPAPTPAPADAAVSIIDFSFTPTPVAISPGSQVVWTNKGARQHLVISDDNRFTSDTLDPGSTFATKLTAAGTYTYHCAIHPTMKGTIVVK